jgi:hypothetical protein
MSFPLGISDSQKKQPPLPPSVVSQSDSGSGRDFDNGANFLTFQGTTFTGKLPIIDYTVTATATDNSDTVSLTVNTVNPFVFTGLKSGKTYKFKIRARNQVYNSADSSEFGPGLATTVPGRTTSAGATNSGNGGGASLSWTAPANGGKAITSYLITPNIGTPIETGNSSTSYTFSGLTVGTGYNFTVAARNENGLGQASTTSNLITITAPVAPTPTPTPSGGGGCTTQPVTITGASLTALNSLGLYEVTVTGTGVNLQPPTNISVGGSNAYNIAFTSTSASGQIAGISAGTTYNIQFFNGCTPLTPPSGINVVAPAYSSGGGPTPTPTPTAPTDCSGANCTNLTACQACTSPNSYTNQRQNTTACPSGEGYFTFCYTPGSCPNVGPTLVSCYTAPTPTPTAPATTYCPSYGYNVLLSGYPCNCPGASGCNPTPTPTTTPTPTGFTTTTYCASTGTQVSLSGYPGNCPGATQSCSGPCLGSWQVVGGICTCVSTTTPTPTTAVPVTVPVTPIFVAPIPTPVRVTPTPTPTSSCICRDFRGRCASAAYCLGFI